MVSANCLSIQQRSWALNKPALWFFFSFGFCFLRRGTRWASHFHWLIELSQFPIANASYHREMIRFSVPEERCEKTLTTKKMPLVKYVSHDWLYAQEVQESWKFCLFDAKASELKSTWSISKPLSHFYPLHLCHSIAVCSSLSKKPC